MKKILLLVISFCSLFVFAGCDLKFEFGTPEPTETVAEKYVISFETFNKNLGFLSINFTVFKYNLTLSR